MDNLPAIIGVLIGFGLVVVVPIVSIMTSHQRKMAELMRRDHATIPNQDMISRLESMQRQLDEMQARQNELIIQQHDVRPPAYRVEERIQE